ncbi:5'-nucleotidase C-terminal domain-containing protein [Paenibacillus sp. OAS669]|uniref:5'-nucleotidase C-terminal domain-containing protein n=1 Tax=Paenibacillus sp. OAS669 TaxID=2663821 RepID=UPI00178A4592|nr:5'-nucleotidase C-terminal domain-containing protein [Paenibacillus sp. OAS669]MBE1443615.1 2',3'-cyclic-nucleotide 2'-phosphodiesterase (5'-nucleotidase family) [Paenibacillus sp. OAS669]
MKKRTAWLSVMLTLFIGASTAVPASAADATSGTATITILHTNDIHSRVEESKEGIGYAKLSTLIKQQKAANPSTLVLDAGDTFHGQTIANLERGESIVKIMNSIGFDAMEPGNHDFNYGSSRLVELSGKAQFPILSANVKKADGTRLLKPYIIKDVAGVKVGIFGLTTPETAYKTHPNNVKGLTFADPVAEAKAMVNELKGKADIIIALAHLGIDKSSVDTSAKVAEQVPGIDVIIDGHSHSTLEHGITVGNTLIAQTGEYSKNIGKVDLQLDGKTIKSKTASLITKPATESVEADPAVLSIIDEIKKSQDSILSQVVGSSAMKLVGEREVVRAGESNLGHLITDAMLDETGADVALTNGGGIRASIEAGQITKGQIITVLPFGNYIQTKKVKGSDIVAALELGVSSYPEPLGGFPHVGGVTFTLDAGKPSGQRVSDVLVKGQPIEPDKDYVLATNDFMAAGGDQYTMFKDYPIANDFSSLEESVIAYLQKIGSVQPSADSRMKVISSASEPQPAPVKPAAPAEAQASSGVYIVQSGDSLWTIARRYGTQWEKLQEWNQLADPNLIFPGQKIVVPAS